jgi:zinc protease
MKRSSQCTLLAGLVSLSLAASPALAPSPASGGEGAARPVARPAVRPVRIPFTEFRLKNGLRVILSEDHSAPTYSICVTYNVGSRDEPKGQTGYAHLFEHMMFQGSEKVGKGEHFILVQTYGGRSNGTTNADRTNYFETLPANQLELGLFLEADRMRSLAVNQANLDNQRHAVQEERRLRVDNQPYGQTYELVIETAYDNFAYKHSTIGSMADLNAATLDDATSFFKAYYSPSNAVLSLVGDFKTEEALGKVKKYFEEIPARPLRPAADISEPEQKGERRRTIEDTFAQRPRIDIVYKIPPGNTRDWLALEVLGRVLMSGRSSRLYQKLVKEKEVVVAVSGGAEEQRGPSLFWLVVTARGGKELAEIERLVDEEIGRVENEPVAQWEMEKARMQWRSRHAEQLHSTQSRAARLGHDAVYYDDPSLLNTLEERIGRVTADDLRRVARSYLRKSNRTVVVTLPAAKTAQPAQ